MIKKRQIFSRWLVLAAIFSLQAGCAALQPERAAEKQSPVKALEKKAAENSHDKATAPTPKPDSIAQRKVKQTAGKVKAEAKEQLSGEVLYYLLSAEIAGQRGQIALSAAFYTKAAEVTRDPEVARQATRVAYYARDDKRALTAVSLWNELEPENIEARQVLAALLVRSGNTELAASHFEYVLTHASQSERQSFTLITSLLSKEKDKEAALAVMQKLIDKRKDNPNALYAYSHLAFLVGNLDEAERTIEKVINLQPEWTEAYILQSNIFNRQGNKAHTLEVLAQVIDKQSENAALRMFYAKNLVDAKRFKDAAKQFSYLTNDEKHQHEARYALGLLALQMNKPAKAGEYFSQLLDDNKYIDEAKYYLAQSYELQNKFDEAIKWYKKNTESKYEFEAELRIALILAKKGNIAEARLHLQNMSPDSLDKELRVYLTEGEMLNDVKQYEEAFKLYSSALEQLENNNRLLYARALTAEKLNYIDIAIKDLQSIVQREPENAQALNALGYTMVDKTDQIEKGFDYIKQALKFAPNDPSIMDSLGWAYYRLGQYDEALKYLRLAFEQLKDAEVAAHLGEVLWVAGDRDAAQAIWDSALQQAPNDDLLLNVIHKFSK